MRASNTALQRVAHLLDDFVRIPGTNIRLGLDSVLGLIPVGGDVAGGVLSAYTLLVATRMGAPPSVLMRMTGNILIDMVVGAVPLLGDLFDVAFKANRRNVALVQTYVDAPKAVEKQSRVVVALILLAAVALIIGGIVLSITVVRWVFSLF